MILVSALSDGYWDIQLSPNSAASVPFGNAHISVWKHETKGSSRSMIGGFIAMIMKRKVEWW